MELLSRSRLLIRGEGEFKNTIKLTGGEWEKGKKVRLWKDFWSKAGLLKDLFPTLNSIAVNKNRLLADYLSNVGRNIQFRLGNR
ncbi:hypothetical protein H5410_058025 [Solanum commersonii]|uniref:Uncharacterized protein n=1 Tax=Solanum commersonii TaxID=4109 RepID=A0A9J5WPI8_SOLCO|nr:hypothetical protein H5410_058025 [Solanum commersonii]